MTDPTMKCIMTARVVAILSIIQLSVSAVALGQRLTLPELVKWKGPQPIYQMRLVDTLPDTLEELIPKTDLVVHGRVESAETYLRIRKTFIQITSLLH